MGTINLYNSLDNSYQTIKGCGKLSDLLPTLDYEHSVILKAGNRLNSDYEVTADDLIFVRKIPGTATSLALAVIITGAIVAGGVVLGEAIGAYVDDKQKKAQEKAQKDAQNLASQITQYPFIKGANNQSALGNAVPFVMGDVYHTPYKMTDGYYTIADGDGVNQYGAKQYYNIVLNLGWGNQLIKNILIGSDSILKNESGIAEGVHDVDDTSVFYDAENKVEVCQAGTSFTYGDFGKKVSCVTDGSEIKHEYGEDAEPLIRTLSDYTKTVEICIQLNGLRQYDSDNSKWVERKIKVVPYWTNVEEPEETDWNVMYFDGMTDNEISLNTNHTVRFMCRKTFTSAEAYGKTIKIKLVKETAELESNSNESCYLAFYQSYCYDNRTSSASVLNDCDSVEEELTDKTTRIGIRLIANDNTTDTLDEIHAYVCGLARTWNGTEWSTKKTATRNPASWILEILTSSVHKHSQYADDELDLESFGAFYTWCAKTENLFYTDGIITEGIKKQDLISTILDECSAVLFINAEGKYEIRVDQAEDTPVALLNSESIQDINYAKDLTRQPDGLKVTFTNRDSWQIDTFYIKTDGTTRTQDDTFTTLNLNYVTTYEHACKIALKSLKQIKLQPKDITVDVGPDGDYYPLLSTVMLQYTTFRTGLNSSVIAGLTKDSSGNITAIKLADLVTMESGKNYGVIIQAVNDSGKKHFYRAATTVAGSTYTLTFTSAILASEIVLPQLGDTVSFGELDENSQFTKIRDVMKITGIANNGSNGYKLTLKNYNESIYDESSEIPEFKSNITQPPKPSKEIPQYTKLEGEPGQNGYSSYTIQLFKRYADTPSVPSGTMAYTFSTAELEGDLNGWSRSVPEVDDANNPCYEIHVTITNQNDTVSILTTDWSEPVLVLKESNITIAEVQEMINKVTPPPTVTADVTFFPVGVNSQSICPKSQSVTTEIHVRQIDEELGFSFGAIELPEGFAYTIDGNKITITCAEGTLVKAGSIIVPVLYKAYKSNIAYVSNSDANTYYIGKGNILGNYDNVDDIPSSPAEESIINYTGETVEGWKNNTAYQYLNGAWTEFDFEPYGYYVYESELTTNNIGIGYTGQKGFRYFNSISSVSDIPAELIIGDYFTWNGEDTESILVEGGKFLQCCVYQYDGEKWKLDETTEHNTTAIFDILKIADSKLSENNSTAETFLERLCSNQAFIKTLVVTGSAFINKLSTVNITLNEEGYIQSSNYIKGTSGFRIDANGNAEFEEGDFRGVLGSPLKLATAVDSVASYQLSDFSVAEDHSTIESFKLKEYFKLILYSSKQTTDSVYQRAVESGNILAELVFTTYCIETGDSTNKELEWVHQVSGMFGDTAIFPPLSRGKTLYETNMRIEMKTKTITWYYGEIISDTSNPDKVGTYEWRTSSEGMEVEKTENYILTTPRIVTDGYGDLYAIKQVIAKFD